MVLHRSIFPYFIPAILDKYGDLEIMLRARYEIKGAFWSFGVADEAHLMFSLRNVLRHYIYLVFATLFDLI